MLRYLLAHKPDLVGVLIVGGGISGALQALREADRDQRKKITLICRDMGPETLKGLSEGLITATLCHPVEAMSAMLVDTMIDVVVEPVTSPVMKMLPFEVLTPENIEASHQSILMGSYNN